MAGRDRLWMHRRADQNTIDACVFKCSGPRCQNCRHCQPSVDCPPVIVHMSFASHLHLYNIAMRHVHNMVPVIMVRAHVSWSACDEMCACNIGSRDSLLAFDQYTFAPYSDILEIMVKRHSGNNRVGPLLRSNRRGTTTLDEASGPLAATSLNMVVKTEPSVGRQQTQGARPKTIRRTVAVAETGCGRRDKNQGRAEGRWRKKMREVSEAVAVAEVVAVENRDKNDGRAAADSATYTAPAHSAWDSPAATATDKEATRSRLEELHRLLNNRKGSLSAPQKKNEEANDRAYDMNQRTIQALDALEEEDTSSEASKKK